MIRSCLLLTAAVFMACIGCGSKGDPLGPVANVNEAMLIRSALGGSGDAAAGDTAADLGTGWAMLRGRFVFQGTPLPPRPKPGVNIKPEEQAVCAPDGPPLERDLMVGAGGGLQNVAIFVRTAPRVHESAEAVPEQPVIFDQENCVFLTHVLGCQVGQTVVLKNSDPVSHNTKIEGRSSTNPIISANTSYDFTFKVEEAVPQTVSCSIHPWMKAYALARDNGYFAVTGPDGTFEIANLPAGVELEFQVWHERGTGTGGGLALSTDEVKDLKWNARGRFKIKLEENEERELVVNVPASAVGA
jgi:plastocyanin